MSRGHLELTPLRAVRARVAVLEFAAAVAEPYRAVDPRLHVVLLRGRGGRARHLSSVSVACVNFAWILTAPRSRSSSSLPSSPSGNRSRRRAVESSASCTCAADDAPVAGRRQRLR